MLDKSPELISDNNLTHIQNEFEQNVPNIVLCSEPFHKVEFLNKLIDSMESPIIFVDMDLLYTGYFKSGMIQKKENVSVFHPDKSSWRQKILGVISKVSEKKFLVIIDSLNGVYNMFDDLESAIFLNSCIMLLSSLGCKTNSSIIVTGIAKKKEDDTWILSPGGKQIIRSRKTGVYFLKKVEKNLIIRTINEGKTNSKVFKIS